MSASAARLRARSGWTFLVACLAVLVIAGYAFYRLPARDSLAFLALFFVLYGFPGSLLVEKVLPLRKWPVGHAVLAAAVGMSATSVLYRIARPIDEQGFLTAGILLTLSIVWSVLQWRKTSMRGIRNPARTDEIAGLVLLLLAVLVLLSFSHFGDLVIRPDGIALRNSLLTESIFHVGLANSVMDAFPPPAIYAAGSEGYGYYHLGMHLQMALFSRLAGIDMLRLASFYFPLTYFGLLAALPFVFVRQFGGPVALAVVCGVLVFGSGFSFIPGLVSGVAGQPWTSFFPSTIYNVFTLNGYLPALIPLFAGLILLRGYFRGDGAAHLVLFALCILAAYALKTTMGLQMAAAGVCAGAALCSGTRTDQCSKVFLGVSLGALLLLVALGLLAINESEFNVIQFAPFGLFERTLTALGLSRIDVIWYPLMWVALMLGALGVRAIGLRALYCAGPFTTRPDPVIAFVGTFFVVGYVVSESMFIGQERGLNNAEWFYVQSLMAAWFLLFWQLVRWESANAHRWIVVTAIVVFSAPSTVQFLALRSVDQYAAYGTDELAVVDFLKSADPHTVVLHPLNLDRPSLAANLAGRPSVFSPYLSFVVEQQGLSQRGRDVLAFFHPDTDDAERNRILRRYGVDLVYVPTRQVSLLTGLQNLRVVLKNPSLTVFRVVVAPTQSSAEGSKPDDAMQ